MVAVMIIFALIVKTKSFADYPGNHTEELKQAHTRLTSSMKKDGVGVSVFYDGIR